jgi:micrococcal nuclease
MAKSTSKRRKLYGNLKKAALAGGAVALIAGSVGVAKRVVSPGEKVVSVIDGDSFKIANDQTVRLLSLDAPAVEFCAGEEAKKALTQKIQGKTVILKNLKTDRYGRVMAMVYVNGESVNEYMIKNGLALHLWDTSTLAKQLGEANDFARDNRLGIFSPQCYQIDPPNQKCPIKGNIDQKDKKTKTYTMPSCDRYNLTVVEKYKGEDWFCTESEAKKAGYAKSDNCK